jgi:hypothetical protein
MFSVLATPSRLYSTRSTVMDEDGPGVHEETDIFRGASETSDEMKTRTTNGRLRVACTYRSLCPASSHRGTGRSRRPRNACSRSRARVRDRRPDGLPQFRSSV